MRGSRPGRGTHSAWRVSARPRRSPRVRWPDASGSSGRSSQTPLPRHLTCSRLTAFTGRPLRVVETTRRPLCLRGGRLRYRLRHHVLDEGRACAPAVGRLSGERAARKPARPRRRAQGRRRRRLLDPGQPLRRRNAPRSRDCTYASRAVAEEVVAGGVARGAQRASTGFEGRSSLKTWIFRDPRQQGEDARRRARAARVPFSSLGAPRATSPPSTRSASAAPTDRYPGPLGDLPARAGPVPEERLLASETLDAGSRPRSRSCRRPRRVVITMRDVEGFDAERGLRRARRSARAISASCCTGPDRRSRRALEEYLECSLSP